MIISAAFIYGYVNALCIISVCTTVIVLKSSWGTSPRDRSLTMANETVSDVLDFSSKLMWLAAQRCSITFICSLYSTSSVVQLVCITVRCLTLGLHFW
jgi:hypothetical protein